MSPKVSVIVPVYNVQEYLGQCLDTILLQTLEDIEVICIDDGSTDDSPNILNTYAFLDSRIKIIHQENIGLGTTRNRGIKEATGEYIIFLDSDDFFEPDMLEKMVAQAEKDKSDVVVAGWHRYDNNLKQDIQTIVEDEKFLKKSPAKPQDFGKDLFDLRLEASWNKLFRSQFLKENNLLFDEVRCVEDLGLLCLSLALASKISVMKEAFIHYRINRPNSLVLNKKNYFKDFLVVIIHLYERMKELHLDNLFPLYTNTVRQVMSWMLKGNTETERVNLNLIKQMLPPELFDMLFFCAGTKVSIIIPVYNAAEFLPECLDSCLNQTLKEIEIICVDDESTDSSLEILNEYAQKDPRIIVLQQKNQRQAIARNKAMEVATGAFIQFLDADDYMEPDACACLYLYSAIFGLDMCQCTAIEFLNYNKQEFIDPYHNLTWLPENFQPVFDHSTIRNVLPSVAVTAWLTFYRRHFLIQNNIRWINKKIAYEDTLFFVESILKAKRVGAIKAPFYHRRIHSESTTQQISKNLNEYIEILKYTLQIVTKYADKDLSSFYGIVFLQKAWQNFARLEPNDKAIMAPFLYDFYSTLQKKYHIVLPPNIHNWCLRYLTTLKKNKKEKLSFKTTALKNKCIKNTYRLTLIEYQRKPNLKISVLGLPVLYSKTIQTPPSGSDKKKNQLRQTVYIKFLGLTLFKIREVIHV